MAPMVSAIYKKRVIPIVWMAKKDKKGHSPESFHYELIENLIAIAPENCRKTLLGDGEFDSNSLQELIRLYYDKLLLAVRRL